MQEKRRNLDPEDEPPEKENRVALNAVGDFDGDLYTGGKSKFEGYHTSLAVDDVEVSKKIWRWYCIPPINQYCTTITILSIIVITYILGR